MNYSPNGDASTSDNIERRESRYARLYTEENIFRKYKYLFNENRQHIYLNLNYFVSLSGINKIAFAKSYRLKKVYTLVWNIFFLSVKIYIGQSLTE